MWRPYSAVRLGLATGFALDDGPGYAARASILFQVWPGLAWPMPLALLVAPIPDVMGGREENWAAMRLRVRQ